MQTALDRPEHEGDLKKTIINTHVNQSNSEYNRRRHLVPKNMPNQCCLMERSQLWALGYPCPSYRMGVDRELRLDTPAVVSVRLHCQLPRPSEC